MNVLLITYNITNLNVLKEIALESNVLTRIKTYVVGNLCLNNMVL